MITQWLAGLVQGAGGGRWSWLSLDDADNDPVRFLTYVIAAVQGVSADLGLEAQVVLQAGALPARDDAVTLLVNDLAAYAEPLFLVLDDYHVIHTEAVDQLLAALVERQPPNFHLVIVSRVDPPLPLSRLRVRRQMLELRAHDLRFTAGEVATFLRRTMGLALAADAVTALEERTEGWIAGLQLAALSLQGRDDPEAFIRAFNGSNRYIIDYLVDEVLSDQPPDVRSFLEQTSILSWLCAPLCDAVLGNGASPTHDSRAILDYLERANLFLVPMDDERKWYRYHHLFADSLQTGLSPSQEQVLHQRAARWYADNGYLPRAIGHALAARDYGLAADLLGGAGREAVLWAGGEFRRYCEWVEMLPDEAVQARPRLRLVYARALQITGQLTRAEQVLSHVRRDLQAAPVGNEELPAMAALYESQCLLERGDLQRAVELAHYAVDHTPASERLGYARALSGLACVEYGLGTFVAATPRFIQVSKMTDSPSLSTNAAECAARGLVLQGKLGAAERLCEEILASSRTKATYNHLAAGVFGTLADLAYHRDALDRIVAYGDQAIELAQRMAPQAPLRAHEIWVHLQFARLRQVQGNDEGAAEAIAMADHVAHEIENAFYLELIEVRQTAFQLGEAHAIPALLRVRPYPAVAFRYLDEYRAWIRAQVSLAEHQPREALAVLDDLLDAARRDGRGLSVIELQIWRALALSDLRQAAGASGALSEAVSLAAPEACFRVFYDSGPAPAGLLLQVRSVAPGFVDRLVQTQAQRKLRTTNEPHPPATRPKDEAGPLLLPLSLQVEALSEREVEILRLLADGLTNQEIGRALFIGVGTVKWYLSNLYGKLAVRNRTGAVARARELGFVT